MSGSAKSPWDAVIDALSVVSFLIGLENLSLNLSEQDLNRQTQDIDRAVAGKMAAALAEIHEHLQEQDEKLNRLILAVEGKK